MGHVQICLEQMPRDGYFDKGPYMSSLTGAFILDFQENIPTTSIESSSYHISCSFAAHYALVHLILYIFLLKY